MSNENQPYHELLPEPLIAIVDLVRTTVAFSLEHALSVSAYRAAGSEVYTACAMQIVLLADQASLEGMAKHVVMVHLIPQGQYPERLCLAEFKVMKADGSFDLIGERAYVAVRPHLAVQHIADFLQHGTFTATPDAPINTLEADDDHHTA